MSIFGAPQGETGPEKVHETKTGLETKEEAEKKEEKTLEEVVFSEVPNKKTGGLEYRSSAPDRKIVILSESSLKPEPGRPYKIRIVEDTNPEDPMKGKYIVEVLPEQVYSELALEAQGAFAANDLETTLQKLKKLKELQEFHGSGPETPENGPVGGEAGRELTVEEEKFLENLKTDFEQQLVSLCRCGYPEAAGMHEEEFAEAVIPLMDKLPEIARMKKELDENNIPFLIVIKQALVSLPGQAVRMGSEEHRGFMEIPESGMKNEFKTSKGIAYLAVDVEDGQNTRVMPVSVAVGNFTSYGRSPLTVEEGLALVTHRPETLKTHGIWLAGSYYAKRGQVPGIWLDKERPKLHYSPIPPTSTAWGTPSCRKRIGEYEEEK